MRPLDLRKIVPWSSQQAFYEDRFYNSQLLDLGRSASSADSHSSSRPFLTATARKGCEWVTVTAKRVGVSAKGAITRSTDPRTLLQFGKMFDSTTIQPSRRITNSQVRWERGFLRQFSPFNTYPNFCDPTIFQILPFGCNFLIFSIVACGILCDTNTQPFIFFPLYSRDFRPFSRLSQSPTSRFRHSASAIRYLPHRRRCRRKERVLLLSFFLQPGKGREFIYSLYITSYPPALRVRFNLQ